MIKVNRKLNGEILGLSIFLGKDDVKKLIDSNINYVEVIKRINTKGIFITFQPVNLPEKSSKKNPLHKSVRKTHFKNRYGKSA